MYSFNSVVTGQRVTVESYDKGIEILDLLYDNKYIITRDDEMKDVWWISVNGKLLFMFTNLQPAHNIHVE